MAERNNLSQKQARDGERWSREGKVEPEYRERSILTAKSAHQHLGAYNAACAACQAEDKLLPKPPAPDLAALRDSYMGDRVRNLLNLTGTDLKDVTNYIVAVIDAKLAAREDDHGDR